VLVRLYEFEGVTSSSSLFPSSILRKESSTAPTQGGGAILFGWEGNYLIVIDAGKSVLGIPLSSLWVGIRMGGADPQGIQLVSRWQCGQPNRENGKGDFRGEAEKVEVRGCGERGRGKGGETGRGTNGKGV